MPRPKAKENMKNFIARYMSSEHAKKKYPKTAQRLAVAYSVYREDK